MKDKIKLWYSLGLWSAQMVRQAAEKGVLTQEECEAIINGADE